MSWSAETASRMKSKLPACFFISSALRETTTSCGPEPQRVLLLARRGGEDDDVGAEGAGELHAHVAEPAEADDADLLALRRRPSGAAASRS